MAGSFSKTRRIFGFNATNSSPVAGTLEYSTDYRDADHELCRQDVEICKVVSLFIGESEDCSDTGGLSATPAIYGEDGKLVINWSTTDTARYNVKINFAWTDKNSDDECPDPSAEIEGDPMIKTFDGKNYRL
tara:strand:+ start:358 stop:753 length:396 start_codon:yes stop_codon:yes gene_type:complete